MHPYLENLKEYPARSRLNVVLGDPQQAAEAAGMVGPEFLKAFPSHDRAHVSDLLGHPFRGTPVVQEGRPPEAMTVLGPYPVLNRMEPGARADFVLGNISDFEDYFREIPEFLLMLPQDRRAEVVQALGVQPPEEFVHDEVEEDPETPPVVGSEVREEGRFGKLAADSEEDAEEEIPVSTVDVDGLKMVLDHLFGSYLSEINRIMGGNYTASQKDSFWDAWLYRYPMHMHVYTVKNSGETVSHRYSALPAHRKAWNARTKYTTSDMPYSLEAGAVSHSDKGKFLEEATEGSGKIKSLMVYAEGADHFLLIPISRISKIDFDLHLRRKDGSSDRRELSYVLEHPDKPSASAEDDETFSPEAQGLTAEEVYKKLSQPLQGQYPVAEIKVKGDRHVRTVSDFEGYPPDEHGNPMVFGKGPEGFIRVMERPSMRVVDIKLSDIRSFQISSGVHLKSLEGSDELANKNVEDLAYIEKYDASIASLRTSLRDTIIAVVDLETVGLLDKLYEDHGVDKRRSVGQLLQIAGQKVRDGSGDSAGAKLPGGLVFVGTAFDRHVRLTPHNLAVLHRESEEGFSERMGDKAGTVPKKKINGRYEKLRPQDDHTDTLHWSLQYAHWHTNPRKRDLAAPGRDGSLPSANRLEVDILGVPRSHSYGKKTIDVPTRLSRAQVDSALSTEVTMLKQHEALREFLAWVRGANIVCGHNMYLFDRKYLGKSIEHDREHILSDDQKVAAEVANDIQKLASITYLDTLHVARIMFLPAVSILAYTSSEDVPADVKEEASRFADTLKKNVTLANLASAFDLVQEHAHNALDDVQTTIRVLGTMIEKLLVWDKHLVHHARYQNDRKVQKVSVAKGFANATKTVPVAKGPRLLQRKRSKF